MTPQQPDDICARPDCGRIRCAPRHGECECGFTTGYPATDPTHGCVCDGKRDHVLCHDFKEFPR